MIRADTEKFRLRHFVEKLVQEGECVVHDEPIDLIDVAAVLDCNPNAVWFRAVGPEKTELVGNVMGDAAPARRRARHRRSAAFRRCCANGCGIRAAPIEVPSAQAPVHEVVLTGERCGPHDAAGASAARARRRTLHLRQHRFCARSAKSGFTNIGCRRLMLRGPRAAGIDLNAPSDLRALYQAAVAQRRALAGRIHGRQPPQRFSRRRRRNAADGRARGHRRRARRAGAGGQMRHHRRQGAGRRRAGARRLYRRARPGRAGGALRRIHRLLRLAEEAIRCSISPPSPSGATRCSRP